MGLMIIAILVCVHIMVLYYCAHYMRKIKDQALSEGMNEEDADIYAHADYKAGLYSPGHPMFKIGIYNIILVLVVIYLLFNWKDILYDLKNYMPG